MDLIIDGVRWVLWLICKGCFFLIDSLYNIIKPILSFDIGTSSVLWDWWGLLCIFLFLFTLYRMFSMFLKAGIDEEYALKLNPLNAVYRLIAIGAIVALMPLFVKGFTALSATVMENVAETFVVSNNFADTKPHTDDPEMQKQIDKLYKEYEGMPSQLFINSASNGKYPPYQLIDINATEGGVDNWFDGIPIIDGVFDLTSALLGQDGDYIYFPDTTMLIFLIVEGVVGMYLFLLMAIQISQRIISIGVKVLISPYPISGIINPDDNSFGLWIRLMIADLISNVVQYIILLFVMALTSSEAVQNFGIVGQGIFFLGGMLAVLIGPGQVAQIIGGDGMGLFQTMQGFQAMGALAGITRAIGSTGAGIVGGAAALGTYGAGRMLGLNSLGNGNMGDGGSENGISSTGGGPYGSGGSGGSKIPPKAFSEPVTNKQVKAGEKFGMDLSGMSKGQASLELEKAGLDSSYWHDFNKQGGASGTIDKGTQTYGFSNTPGSVTASAFDEGNASEAFTNVGSASMNASEQANISGSSASANLHDGNASVSSATDSASLNTSGQPRLSKEGTFARRVADSNNMGARVATKVARNAYFSAGSRLMGQKTVVRGGKYIPKNTMVQNLSNLHAGIKDLRNPRNNTVMNTLVQNDEIIDTSSMKDKRFMEEMEDK